jgi:hypothetical protein
LSEQIQNQDPEKERDEVHPGQGDEAVRLRFDLHEGC